MALIREVSLGNLLTAGTVVITAAIAWGTFSTRVESTEIKVKEVEHKAETTRIDISQMNIMMGRVDERMKGLEKSMDKQEKMLIEITTKLK